MSTARLLDSDVDDELDSGESDNTTASSADSERGADTSWFGAVGGALSSLGGKLKESTQKLGSPFNKSGSGVVSYLAAVLDNDAAVKFVSGFKFRPDGAFNRELERPFFFPSPPPHDVHWVAEPLVYSFACHLVSRSELVEGVAFVTRNFLCFLGNVEGDDVDDAGRPLDPLRVILPLKTVTRIDFEMCVVKGVYNAGEAVDAMLLSAGNAKHQIVWVDEFDRACDALHPAWEDARKPERANDALPVSLVLNPEFASLDTSTETSPRLSARRPKSALAAKPVMEDVSIDEGDSAVSEEYDSEHVVSVDALQRVSPSDRPVSVNTPVVVDARKSVKAPTPPPAAAAVPPVDVALPPVSYFEASSRSARDDDDDSTGLVLGGGLGLASAFTIDGSSEKSTDWEEVK